METKIEIEWEPCPRCGIPVVISDDIIFDTDRNGQAIDIEHECQ